MHNFMNSLRSCKSPCASGVSGALRPRRLMYASDSGVNDDRCPAISIARSRALPLTVSWTNPFLSASCGETGTPIRMCMSAAGVPIVRANRCVPPAPGTNPKLGSGKPIWYSPSSAMRRSQESVNSNAPARHVPEMAAMTGLGMLSHNRNGPVNESRLWPLATGRAHRLREANEFWYRIVTNERTGRSACHDDDGNVRVAGARAQRLKEGVARLLVDIDASFSAEGNDRDSIDDSCCQNVGVHRAPHLESLSLRARGTPVLEQSRHICHLCF